MCFMGVTGTVQGVSEGFRGIEGKFQVVRMGLVDVSQVVARSLKGFAGVVEKILRGFQEVLFSFGNNRSFQGH